jgi:ketosteroid isomerase-like protein
MSPQDVEVARRAIETLASGDKDNWMALHDPDCEITPLTTQAEGGKPYRGHEGCRAFWEDVHTAFLDWRPRVEEAADRDEAVLLTLQFEGRGRSSGAPIDRRVWQVCRVRDSKALWWRIYTTEEDAVEAIRVRAWRHT